MPRRDFACASADRLGKLRLAGALCAGALLVACSPVGLESTDVASPDSAAFKVVGTDRIVSRAEMPSRVRTICLANVGDPAAQEAAFAADPGFAAPGVYASPTLRSAAFVWTSARIGGGAVTSGGSPQDGCTINDAGLSWRVLPDGRIQVSTSRADDW